MEVELKLLVAREDLGRILAAQAVRQRAQGRARTMNLVSVYFDTPELDLHAARLALRLRQSGDTWLQALKGGAASTRGPDGTGGVRVAVAGRRIDFGLLEGTPHGPMLAKRRVRETLRPVFHDAVHAHAAPPSAGRRHAGRVVRRPGEVRAGARARRSANRDRTQGRQRAGFVRVRRGPAAEVHSGWARLPRPSGVTRCSRTRNCGRARRPRRPATRHGAR